MLSFKKGSYYWTSYHQRDTAKGTDYLGRLLHLISNIDLPELLEEAQHGKLQLLIPSLRQTRVRQVHELQHSGERWEKHTLLMDMGRNEGFLARGVVSRLRTTGFLTFCGHCHFGSRTDKTDNKTLTRAHPSSVQGYYKASISLLTGMQGLGFNSLQK